jgi:hypothetical protein
VKLWVECCAQRQSNPRGPWGCESGNDEFPPNILSAHGVLLLLGRETFWKLANRSAQSRRFRPMRIMLPRPMGPRFPLALIRGCKGKNGAGDNVLASVQVTPGSRLGNLGIRLESGSFALGIPGSWADEVRATQRPYLLRLSDPILRTQTGLRNVTAVYSVEEVQKLAYKGVALPAFFKFYSSVQ